MGVEVSRGGIDVGAGTTEDSVGKSAWDNEGGPFARGGEVDVATGGGAGNATIELFRWTSSGKEGAPDWTGDFIVVGSRVVADPSGLCLILIFTFGTVGAAGNVGVGNCSTAAGGGAGGGGATGGSRGFLDSVRTWVLRNRMRSW
jgi:hypothetical protein